MVRAVLSVVACLGVATGLVHRAGPVQRTAVRAARRQGPTMKLYDWKRREADESGVAGVDCIEFRPDNIRGAPGSTKRKMRKGRGIAAGKGATCGFGMRGQKSRSTP